MVQQFQDAMEEGLRSGLHKSVQEYMLAEIGELRAEVARLRGHEPEEVQLPGHRPINQTPRPAPPWATREPEDAYERWRWFHG